MAAEALCRRQHVVLGKKTLGVLDAVFDGEPSFDFERLWSRAQKREPSISRASIYNALRRFTAAGVLRAIGRRTSSSSTPL